MEVVTESILTCPKCGFSSLEFMPDNACVYFYECKSCGELLKPLAGNCCVFCSYGTIPCPPIQISGKCCQ
ncbi:GDCCVxC domain-containing (seleno)protein [Vibrio coralliilyticus]|uniref:GDCCVxC domain-containing (seleno)protein n=1 Tax=Vibrio coralliilyticus TaxID=190893 RepID=UPI00265F72C3|nr:GDCCVxC domain-containing (seleno)protein [Vibrio coralliilyticus]